MYYVPVKALYTVGYSTSLVSLTAAMVILCRFRSDIRFVFSCLDWFCSCSISPLRGFEQPVSRSHRRVKLFWVKLLFTKCTEEEQQSKTSIMFFHVRDRFTARKDD